ncbi:MAG TPA: iron ABC transporter permease [Elusimicrobia bacterium]|nr:MAG: hypothetical protein A2278_07380 [Elusimicrobia bacterium RIFOXYA12_FULL_49_49]OGS09753.1 MAG: hypothetical protein A2386_03760 [Elusimicrobia bacterium RIFOXYB1_FULL_48_9]OGS16112.1 MAG: hypothetical protein A2251_02885 [Elusimicrobia bacterium RIFOXYA2_FULL_47_53]OGS26738.1 MAG: hypothetical protein A2339_03935 [Elusimicrobia bacterium RIFOXYB12_FULL_50_12]OGS30136.1 MAG: hypothetical protein A2323_01650 [Elusimicrobia bacterium RIFOXYB2_FULL_46_23]HBU69244.1 iron ABC transporter per
MAKKYLSITLSAVFLAAALVCALYLGGSSLSFGEIANAVLNPRAGTIPSEIIWQIRIPRILLGLLVGMGLASSGAVLQGMLRNQLADPYTLGISGGAAFGVTAAIVSGAGAVSVFFMPLGAFAGTLICIGLVYIIASRKSFSASYLILTGVILGFIFSAAVLLMFAVADPKRVHSALFWLMGDLSSPETGLVKMAAAVILPGIAVLLYYAREINILTLGEEKAKNLGIETGRLIKILFITASLITAACVSASGIIGFVGLIVPHWARKFTGPDNEVLLPVSAIFGGGFLVLCDAVARSIIAPIELPVGVITGLIGGIFFLSFLYKSSEKVF